MFPAAAVGHRPTAAAAATTELRPRGPRRPEEGARRQARWRSRSVACSAGEGAACRSLVRCRGLVVVPALGEEGGLIPTAVGQAVEAAFPVEVELIPLAEVLALQRKKQ